MNVFIDTDIILDLLAKREPFYIYAAELFTLVDRKKIKAFTSPIIFANLHYILKKQKSNDSVLQSLRKLKALVKILPIDTKVIELALNSDFKDFEDAIQYFTAVNDGIEILVTRNKTDYSKAKITISTPEEFIKTWHIHAGKGESK